VTAFTAYLGALDDTILSPEFRERIAGRERRGEYPFSAQNIYRVLFAAAPVLHRGWVTLASLAPLDPGDPVLGTSLRCFRYLHVLLVDMAPPGRAVAELLEPIAARAMRVTTRPACFCPPQDGAVLVCDGPPVSVDVALRLATSLRQYADTRWLGQHDQGFAGKPPSQDPGGLWRYVRCFGRLPPAMGLPGLEVITSYRLAAGAGTAFDPFRGEVTEPPLREAIRAAMIVTPGSGRHLDEQAAQRLLREAVVALRKASADQPGDVAAGERLVADEFSRELCDTARRRGVDPGPWRAEIMARLPSAAPASECLTEAYLSALSRSVQEWRSVLCAGS